MEPLDVTLSTPPSVDSETNIAPVTAAIPAISSAVFSGSAGSPPEMPDNVHSLSAPVSVPNDISTGPVTDEMFKTLNDEIAAKNKPDVSSQTILYDAWKTGVFSSIKSSLVKNSEGAYEVGTYIREGNPPEVCYKMEVTYTLIRNNGDDGTPPQTISFRRTLFTTEPVSSRPDRAIMAVSKYKDLVIKMAQDSRDLEGFPDDINQRESLRSQKSFLFHFADNKQTGIHLQSIKLLKVVDGIDEKFSLQLKPGVKNKRVILNLASPGSRTKSESTNQVSPVEYYYLSKESSLKNARYELKPDNLLSEIMETGTAISWVSSTKEKIRKNFEELETIQKKFKENKFLIKSLADLEYLSTNAPSSELSPDVKQYAEAKKQIDSSQVEMYEEWKKELTTLRDKEKLESEDEHRLEALSEEVEKMPKDQVSVPSAGKSEEDDDVDLSKSESEIEEPEIIAGSLREGKNEVPENESDSGAETDSEPETLGRFSRGNNKFYEQISNNLTILENELEAKKNTNLAALEPLKQVEIKIQKDLNDFKLEIARFQKLNHNALTLHAQLKAVQASASTGLNDPGSDQKAIKNVLASIKDKELKEFDDQYRNNNQFITRIIDSLNQMQPKGVQPEAPPLLTKNDVLIYDGFEPESEESVSIQSLDSDKST